MTLFEDNLFCVIRRSLLFPCIGNIPTAKGVIFFLRRQNKKSSVLLVYPSSEKFDLKFGIFLIFNNCLFNTSKVNLATLLLVSWHFLYNLLIRLYWSNFLAKKTLQLILFSNFVHVFWISWFYIRLYSLSFQNVTLYFPSPLVLCGHQLIYFLIINTCLCTCLNACISDSSVFPLTWIKHESSINANLKV